MKLKQILGFALGPVLAAMLGLLTVPLMAWTFSPDVIGKIAMLNTFLAGCSLVLTLGLDQAYVREYHEVSNKSALLSAFLIPSLFVTVIFAVVILYFHENVSQILFAESNRSFNIVLIVAIALLASILFRFLSLVLRMKEQGLKFSLIQISSKLSLLLSLIVLYFLKLKYGFIIALFFSGLSLVVAVLLALLFTQAECVFAFTTKKQPLLFKQGIKFGSPLIISGFAYWGLTSIDKLAIRYYSGMEQLGIYSVAFSFAAVMTIFQRVFSTIWAPVVYKWHKNGVKMNQFNLVTDWVVIILSSVFFIVILLSPILSYLLPDAYFPVIYLLPACMLFPVFYTLSETTVVGMNVARKTGYAIVITIIPLLLNLLLSYLLIPIYGAGGAAVAVASAFFLYLILRTEISKRLWVNFATSKLYITAAILLFNGIWSALLAEHPPLYVSILSLTCVYALYKERYINIKNDLKIFRG
ncbi:MAG: polysaccharide biosynthesis protein [Gammaproteobacteria bacterium]|nr:MAG: polysaccharide biosynthesis protein [Gammaproteobacteria bacterium]